jgi:hypothetical protein
MPLEKLSYSILYSFEAVAALKIVVVLYELWYTSELPCTARGRRGWMLVLRRHVCCDRLVTWSRDIRDYGVRQQPGATIKPIVARCDVCGMAGTQHIEGEGSSTQYHR